MSATTDYAFEIPVLLPTLPETVIRTVAQATSILHANMRELFTIDALNVLLKLERAAEGDEVEEARQAFLSWAAKRALAHDSAVTSVGRLRSLD
jgi:hypothetical protein